MVSLAFVLKWIYGDDIEDDCDVITEYFHGDSGNKEYSEDLFSRIFNSYQSRD